MGEVAHVLSHVLGEDDIKAAESDEERTSSMATSVASMASFLSLCSRYPGGPWAGLLQQTIKDKQQKGT